jgi:hypothetical protein
VGITEVRVRAGRTPYFAENIPTFKYFAGRAFASENAIPNYSLWNSVSLAEISQRELFYFFWNSSGTK